MSLLLTRWPYPAKAPPIVTGPDGFCCSQTPAILWSLGKKFGLYPDDSHEALAMQVEQFNSLWHSIFESVRSEATYRIIMFLK